MSEIFTHPVQVYYEDTDAGGIVYHAQYLSFMSRARCEWCKAQGLSLKALQEAGTLIPVRSVNIRYLSPAFLEDALVVTVEVKSQRKVGMVFHQRVYRKNQPETILCEADVEVVAVNEKLKPVKLPL
jgi:tol-pal system-associated acyl-CoA thioesterase